MRTSRRSCIPTLPARSTEGRAALLVLLGAVAILAAAASLRFGSQSFSLGELVGSLFEDGQDTVRRILLYVRLPRTVAGATAGAALAMAGALIQAVLNNAMASPNVIGVNAGAGFAAMLVAGAFPPRRRWCRRPPFSARWQPPSLSICWRCGQGFPAPP